MDLVCPFEIYRCITLENGGWSREHLYSVGPVHLSLEGVLCHRGRRRHRDRKGREGMWNRREGRRNANWGGGGSYIPVSSRGRDEKKSRRGARSAFFTDKKDSEGRKKKETWKRKRGYLSRAHASNKKNVGSDGVSALLKFLEAVPSRMNIFHGSIHHSSSIFFYFLHFARRKNEKKSLLDG